MPLIQACPDQKLSLSRSEPFTVQDIIISGTVLLCNDRLDKSSDSTVLGKYIMLHFDISLTGTREVTKSWQSHRIPDGSMEACNLLLIFQEYFIHTRRRCRLKAMWDWLLQSLPLEDCNPSDHVRVSVMQASEDAHSWAKKTCATIKIASPLSQPEHVHP